MASIPKRDSQRPAEYLAARSLVLSGHLERRTAQLGLPPERPMRRGRLLAGGTTPAWAFDPDELRAAPPASALVGVDMTAVIRRRLADSGRHARAHRYLEAAGALADAEQLVTRHAPALRELRRRGEETRLRAQEVRQRAWRQRGADTNRSTAAPAHQKIVELARALRRKDQFAAASLSELARVLRSAHQVTLKVRTIREILRKAGV